MSVGIDAYPYDSKYYSHWGALNKYLIKKPNSDSKEEDISQILKNETRGEFRKHEIDIGDFTYDRQDGKQFKLADCATGLKSFALLQMLHERGFFGSDSLFIIDEPEAHLHPQWVVEYARMIVMLHKELNATFFIASHHPDMISAIRYIAEKEEVLDSVNFYLAEKSKESEYQYDFKHQGTDIEEIFGSFNIAFDRIRKYGPQEDED